MDVIVPGVEPIVWARHGKSSGKRAYSEKDGNYVQWLVDGSQAMYEMCDAFFRATKFIYLIDSYFNPLLNLARGDNDYRKLRFKSVMHQELLNAIEDLNEVMGVKKYSIPLISLLRVKADRGVKVRVVIFHPDSIQDEMAGPFGWLEAWGIVRYWSNIPPIIHLKLAMMGITRPWSSRKFEGHEAGGHHQKSAVVCTDEGLIGFCGGIDIAKNRWTLPSHLANDTNLDAYKEDEKNLFPNNVLGEWSGREYRPKNVPYDIPLWHDVHAKVIGPAAYDLALNFCERYVNAETNLTSEMERRDAAEKYAKTPEYKKYPAYDELVHDDSFNASKHSREQTIKDELKGCGSQLDVSASLLSCDEGYSKNKVSTQIVRTYTGMDVKDYGIWDVYKNLFSVAKKNIYIESQYAFADKDILKILISNIKRKKELKVIIVAPLMPDSYDEDIMKNLTDLIGASSNFSTKQPLLELRPEMKKTRVAAYSLQSKFGNRRVPIYVHAKVAVVDDTWAIVGSANLDTMGVSHVGSRIYWVLPAGSSEIAILVKGQAHALALRRKLVQEHLGHKAPKNVDDFNSVYNAFIEGAKENKQPNYPSPILDGNQDVHIAFHRVYDYLEDLEKKRLEGQEKRKWEIRRPGFQ